MKSADQYLSLNYPKTVRLDEEGSYVVEVPDLPGCAADGETPDEAFSNLRDAMHAWIASRLAAGLDVPEPRTETYYSGRLLLRMPKSLHESLARMAEVENVSLNQYLVSLLSAAAGRQESQRTPRKHAHSAPTPKAMSRRASASRPYPGAKASAKR
jgi:antitoxin HicB